MLKHHLKLRKLCTTNGKVDGRKLRSKAFQKELVRIIKDSKVSGLDELIDLAIKN